MSKLPIAPYEIASDIRTLRKGNFLYFEGKKYRCPELTLDELLTIVDNIKKQLEPPPKLRQRLMRAVRHLWGIKNAKELR